MTSWQVTAPGVLLVVSALGVVAFFSLGPGRLPAAADVPHPLTLPPSLPPSLPPFLLQEPLLG